jgi:hypothetical protein
MFNMENKRYKYMSMRSNLTPAILIGVLATAAIVGGAVSLALLGNEQTPNTVPPSTLTPTLTPTVSPTAIPTDPPTTSPTASPSPTARPTASRSPSPSPSPTPEPVATSFQNATLTYGEYINQTLTWVVNGTLIDIVNSQGISDLTISVIDATNSSLVYGTTVTSENGHFEYTFAIMQPPTVQLVFAGYEQYLASTSSTIEMAPP